LCPGSADASGYVSATFKLESANLLRHLPQEGQLPALSEMRLTHDEDIGSVLPPVFARQTSRPADSQQQVGRLACGTFVKPGDGLFHHRCHGAGGVLFPRGLDAPLDAIQSEKWDQRVELLRQLGRYQADGTDDPLKDKGNLVPQK